MSNDQVKRELLHGSDDLENWARNIASPSFFTSTDDLSVISAYGELVTWVQQQEQYSEDAKVDFADAVKADAWVIAHAKAHDLTVVTHEVFNANIQKKVPIPNVCRAFDVPYVDTFKMLTYLGVQFLWRGMS